MEDREEWAINPAGDVMLAITGTLSVEPVDAHLTPMGSLILRLEDGSQETYRPNRKVSSAIRQKDKILVAETGPDGTPKGRWVPTRSLSRGLGMSPR